MSRRIGGAGGGSDPGPRKGATAIVATGAALVVAVGGGGAIGGGAAVDSSASSTVESALARDLGAKKTNAKNAARRGDTAGAWRRMGLKTSKRSARQYVECVTHSVGQVQEFLARTPCRRLDQMLYPLADDNGNIAMIAVSWVEFRGRTAASRFLDISDTFGTGYVKPLGGAVLAMADVHLTGQHYASRSTKAVAVVAEVEPVTGEFDDAVLDAVAEVAIWLPRP